MFSPNMVPVRTQVSISFQRVVSMEEEDFVESAEGAGWDVRNRIDNKNEEEFGDGVQDWGDLTESGSGSLRRRWHVVVCGIRREDALTRSISRCCPQQNGFSGNGYRIMAAIAMAESGSNAEAHNDNANTGDNSYGLWQINMLGSMGAVLVARSSASPVTRSCSIRRPTPGQPRSSTTSRATTPGPSTSLALTGRTCEGAEMSFWDRVGAAWSDAWRSDFRPRAPWTSITQGGAYENRLTEAVTGGRDNPAQDAIADDVNKALEGVNVPNAATIRMVKGVNESLRESKKNMNTDMATMTPVEDRPLKFNPPLHPNNQLRRVDFASTSDKDRDTSQAKYERDPFSKDIDTYRQYRLGRIIQAEEVVGGAGRDTNEHRWGFRFHYNPEKLDTSVQANQNIVMDTNSPVALTLSMANLGPYQTHNLQFLLNRIPDLEGTLTTESYEPDRRVSEDDVDMIRAWGTMWDLEYLFRINNGVWDLKDLGKSGNIGMLQPSPSYFYLGPGIRHYGFVSNMRYEHIRFSPKMVPILTQVQLTFRRFVHVKPENLEDWMQWASYHTSTQDEMDEIMEGASSSSSSGEQADSGSEQDGQRQRRCAFG